MPGSGSGRQAHAPAVDEIPEPISPHHCSIPETERTGIAKYGGPNGVGHLLDILRRQREVRGEFERFRQQRRKGVCRKIRELVDMDEEALGCRGA